jgi:uncharacterized OB-fold protein
MGHPDLTKPVPVDDPDHRCYWEAAGRGELALQQCATCGEFSHPPGPGCPHCGGAELAWVTLGSSVTGVVYSFIVVQRAFLESFADDVPYVVALADVDGAPGVRITANVLGAEPGDVSIGMPVRMVWPERPGGRRMPQWSANEEGAD